MSVLIEEYGQLVITCLCVIMFLTLFHMMVFGDKISLNWIYNTDMVDAEQFKTSNLVSNFEASPHFEALSIKKNPTKYQIIDKTFTRDNALDIVKIYKTDGTEYTKDELDKVLTILVYRYDLAMTNTDADGNTLTNPQAVYKDVEATDKYGNVLYNADGTAQMKSVLKYDETTLDNLTDETPITLSDEDLAKAVYPRYRLVYRVQDGQKKAEYSTLIVKY